MKTMVHIYLVARPTRDRVFFGIGTVIKNKLIGEVKHARQPMNMKRVQQQSCDWKVNVVSEAENCVTVTDSTSY